MVSFAFSVRRSASAQDWFKTGTGLGVSKARVGVADFAAKDTPSQPLATLFSDVVRTDLDYCGILELVSKSYNPLQSPGTPAEVDYKAWSSSPASAQLLAFGNFTVSEERGDSSLAERCPRRFPASGDRKSLSRRGH